MIIVQCLILCLQETAQKRSVDVQKKLIIAWGFSYSEHPFEEGPKILLLAEREINWQFLRKDLHSLSCICESALAGLPFYSSVFAFAFSLMLRLQWAETAIKFFPMLWSGIWQMKNDNSVNGCKIQAGRGLCGCTVAALYDSLEYQSPAQWAEMVFSVLYWWRKYHGGFRSYFVFAGKLTMPKRLSSLR